MNARVVPTIPGTSVPPGADLNAPGLIIHPSEGIKR